MPEERRAEPRYHTAEEKASMSALSELLCVKLGLLPWVLLSRSMFNTEATNLRGMSCSPLFTRSLSRYNFYTL